MGQLLVLGVLLVACGSPTHQYVRTPGDLTAFKLPSSWTVFDETVLPGSAVQAAGPGSTDWVLGFDSDPTPSPGNVMGATGTPATDHPNGVARIVRLPAEEGGAISADTLRNLVVPIDALSAGDAAGPVRMLRYEDGVVRDGLHGVRLEFQVVESALTGTADGQQPTDLLDARFVQVSQVAYVDDASGFTFVMAVMCSIGCFERNRGEIDAALDSWTVLP